MEDGRIGLDEFDFPGDHDVIEQIEAGIFVSNDGKFLNVPVGQAVQWITGCLEPVQEFDGAGDDSRDGFFPFFVIGMDEMGVLRELRGEVCHGLCKGMPFVLLEVPCGKVNFSQETVNGLRVWKIFLENPVRIPIDEDAAEVEDEGAEGGGHDVGCIVFSGSS